MKYLEALDCVLPAKFGEAKTNCIKRLGQRVISRTFESQVNEQQILEDACNEIAGTACFVLLLALCLLITTEVRFLKKRALQRLHYGKSLQCNNI